MFTLEEGHTASESERRATVRRPVLPPKVCERYTPPELLWRNQGERSEHWATLKARKAGAAPVGAVRPPVRPPESVGAERLRPFFKQPVHTHSGVAKALTGGLTSG